MERNPRKHNGKPIFSSGANSYRPPSLKTYVQRCYEGVHNDETKAVIEREMKEVLALPTLKLTVDNNPKSSGWFDLGNRLGHHAASISSQNPYLY
jgi:hypothetical protein